MMLRIEDRDEEDGYWKGHMTAACLMSRDLFVKEDFWGECLLEYITTSINSRAFICMTDWFSSLRVTTRAKEKEQDRHHATMGEHDTRFRNFSFPFLSWFWTAKLVL